MEYLKKPAAARKVSKWGALPPKPPSRVYHPAPVSPKNRPTRTAKTFRSPKKFYQNGAVLPLRGACAPSGNNRRILRGRAVGTSCLLGVVIGYAGLFLIGFVFVRCAHTAPATRGRFFACRWSRPRVVSC